MSTILYKGDILVLNAEAFGPDRIRTRLSISDPRLDPKRSQRQFLHVSGAVSPASRDLTCFAAGGWVRIQKPVPPTGRPNSSSKLQRSASFGNSTRMCISPPPQPVEQQRVEPAPEPSSDVDDRLPDAKEKEAVDLSGFEGSSSHINGTFVSDAHTVNGRQVYNKGLECIWYHNGAWRIGIPMWLNNTSSLGVCQAYVSSDAENAGSIAVSSTWMACIEGAVDPDVDGGAAFAPQMKAKAARRALDAALFSNEPAGCIGIVADGARGNVPDSPCGSESFSATSASASGASYPSADPRRAQQMSRLTGIVYTQSVQAHLPLSEEILSDAA